MITSYKELEILENVIGDITIEIISDMIKTERYTYSLKEIVFALRNLHKEIEEILKEQEL